MKQFTHFGFAYMGKVTTMLAPNSSLAQEALSGVSTVQSLGAEDRIVGEIHERHRSALVIAARKNLIFGAAMAGITFVIYSGYSLCFFFGGELFRKGQINAGDLITVFLSSAFVLLPMDGPDVQSNDGELCPIASPYQPLG